MNNIPPSIEEKRRKKLHKDEQHPICMLKEHIQAHFQGYALYDDLDEVVSLKANFDDLLFPLDHPSRKPTDTYFVDQDQVLRTHTSVHQTELLKKGETQFLVTGDVYRKDTIDRTHYPVFHQIEGVKLVGDKDPIVDLKTTIDSLVNYLYPGINYRYLDDYFPFTNPSLQVEIELEDGWMEILGAGMIHPTILKNCRIQQKGWAFGLGLDRLLLKKCNIPDIRYLWSEDDRFLSQFVDGLTTFQAYSKYPPIYKDISFWVDHYVENSIEQLWVEHNNCCELIREVTGDLAEDISLMDKYQKGDRVSLAYRITYRSYDRTLTNEEINGLQERVRKTITEQFAVQLR